MCLKADVTQQVISRRLEPRSLLTAPTPAADVGAFNIFLYWDFTNREFEALGPATPLITIIRLGNGEANCG